MKYRGPTRQYVNADYSEIQILLIGSQRMCDMHHEMLTQHAIFCIVVTE